MCGRAVIAAFVAVVAITLPQRSDATGEVRVQVTVDNRQPLDCVNTTVKDETGKGQLKDVLLSYNGGYYSGNKKGIVLKTQGENGPHYHDVELPLALSALLPKWETYSEVATNFHPVGAPGNEWFSGKDLHLTINYKHALQGDVYDEEIKATLTIKDKPTFVFDWHNDGSADEWYLHKKSDGYCIGKAADSTCYEVLLPRFVIVLIAASEVSVPSLQKAARPSHFEPNRLHHKAIDLTVRIEKAYKQSGGQ